MKELILFELRKVFSKRLALIALIGIIPVSYTHLPALWRRYICPA